MITEPSSTPRLLTILWGLTLGAGLALGAYFGMRAAGFAPYTALLAGVLVAGVRLAYGVCEPGRGGRRGCRPGAPGGPMTEFRLAGDVTWPGPLTVAALESFPSRTVRTEIACSCGPPRRHVYTGPLLYDVIMAAAPGFDPHAKDRIRYVVSVTGADGHRATLSWGEIDPDYGGTDVLLAVTVDDHGLDGDGPQLAVPHDKGGGRYVARVTDIWVGPPAQNG